MVGKLTGEVVTKEELYEAAWATDCGLSMSKYISEDTSLDSFISGFRLAWRLSAELNHYDDERPVRCQAAEKPGARFTLKKEDDEQ